MKEKENLVHAVAIPCDNASFNTILSGLWTVEIMVFLMGYVVKLHTNYSSQDCNGLSVEIAVIRSDLLIMLLNTFRLVLLIIHSWTRLILAVRLHYWGESIMLVRRDKILGLLNIAQLFPYIAPVHTWHVMMYEYMEGATRWHASIS